MGRAAVVGRSRALLAALCGALLAGPGALEAQVARAGFVPPATVYDPRLAYVAYGPGDGADPVAARVDLWGRRVGASLGADLLTGGASGTGHAFDAALSYALLRTDHNCFPCLSVLLQLGGSLATVDGEREWEAPVSVGLSQRAFVGAVDTHAWLAVGAIGAGGGGHADLGAAATAGLHMLVGTLPAPCGPVVAGTLRRLGGSTRGGGEIGLACSLRRSR